MTAEVAGSARRIAAQAWRFRHQVEREAEVRFARLAGRLASAGAPGPVIELARRASADERRHAVRCAEQAAACGAPVAAAGPPAVPEIAPARLGARERVLYEVVAACCLTETESLAVLSTLLGCARGPALRQVLRELAGDEVAHGRLGWAHLAFEQGRGDTAFLGPLVPAMLEGGVAPGLFRPAPPELEDEALLEHGVLPRAAQRAVFVRTLEEVVFPGLARCGVDPGPARAWLAARQAGEALDERS